MKHEQIKKMTVMAMLTAMAYVAVVILRIPAVSFLKYEPKDVIIAFGGFLYGPLSALSISVLVSFVEMLTISDTGWIGFLMNVLSSAAFACTAGWIYQKRHTLSGAVIGLALGALLTTALMLLWNYALTPLYLGQPRADVAAMLLPIFLPFNLFKGTLNSAITILLYRPTVQGLRRAGLFPRSDAAVAADPRSKLLLWLGAGAVALACLLYLFLH